jgi:hypothetical protein
MALTSLDVNLNTQDYSKNSSTQIRDPTSLDLYPNPCIQVDSKDTFTQISDRTSLDLSPLREIDVLDGTFVKTEIISVPVTEVSDYPNEIICGDQTVGIDDFKRLEDGNFLNDTLINALGRYLDWKNGYHNDIVFFNSYLMVIASHWSFVNAQFLAAKFLVAPICFASHWMLIVFETSDCTAWYYDSMYNEDNRLEAERLVKTFLK